MTFAQYHRETLDLEFEVKRHRFGLKGSKWSELTTKERGEWSIEVKLPL